MDDADLRNRFEFHPAIAQRTQEQHDHVRRMHLEVAQVLNELLPEGREKSTAVTKLEEAMMWANAAIARS